MTILFLNNVFKLKASQCVFTSILSWQIELCDIKNKLRDESHADYLLFVESTSAVASSGSVRSHGFTSLTQTHWESQVDQCSLHRAAAGALIGQMWHISGRWVLFLAYQSSCCCTFGVYFNFLIQKKNHGWWCVFLKNREINEVCFCKSQPWCRLV